MFSFYIIRGKKFLYLVLDICIVISSYLFAYLIRFYPKLNSELKLLSVKHILLIIVSNILPFYLFQVYRIMWTYSNINDIYKLIAANICAFTVFISAIFYLDFEYSRFVFILSFMFIPSATIFYRILLRDYYSRKKAIIPEILQKKSKSKILIIGAGEAGRTIFSEYKKIGKGSLISGFVDDNKSKIGDILNSKKIYGPIKNISDFIRELKITEIIVAMPSIQWARVNKIITKIKKKHPSIPIKILPMYVELPDDTHLTSSLREVTFVDLIDRSEFEIDSSTIEEEFSGKKILITGAGGSIGSEICRQLLKFKIKQLIAVGRGEFSIYNLIKSLNKYVQYMNEKPDIKYRIADVKDFKLLDKLFKTYKPDIVFHAAAHKHVPLMEFNELEAIQNNVVGTKNILELSSKHNVSKFVLVSTDKAVRPTNIMGATKRLAELLTGYYKKEKKLKTSIVRFGNVFGSRGSVIPLLKEQINNGGPVTITHPDITRYFMSIPEASLLVINAASLSKGGEIFVLDMGQQYKLVDIARKLIEFHGYTPDEDIKIEYTGLRPGEKLYEELFYDSGILINTLNEKIFVLNKDSSSLDKETVEKFFTEEINLLIEFNSEEIREKLNELVPEYNQTNESMDESRLIN